MKFKRIMLLVVLCLLLAGCKNKDASSSSTSVARTGNPAIDSLYEDIDADKIPNPLRLNEDNIKHFFSEDGEIEIVLDYNTVTTMIYDGEKEIPVDICMGYYGTQIEKNDLYDDGDPEYLIIECESTRGDLCQYGLCIAFNYKNKKYLIRRFDSVHFTDVFLERFTYEYDEAKEEITFSIKDDPDSVITIPLKDKPKDQEFVGLDLKNVVYMNLIDKWPWINIPVGVVYSGSETPVYDLNYAITAPVIIDHDYLLDVGKLRGYCKDSQVNSKNAEIDNEVYSCGYDINNDGMEDRIVTNLSETEGCVKLFLGYTQFEESTKVRYDKSSPDWAMDFGKDEDLDVQIFATTVEGRDYLVTVTEESKDGKQDYKYEVFFMGDGCLYSVETNSQVFDKNSKEKGSSEFFKGLYEWINDSSQLFAATDPDDDNILLYSVSDNVMGPDRYFSRKK